MANPCDLIDAEIESFAREWDGPLPNGLLNSLGDRLCTALAADPLVEALESDRLRAALERMERWMRGHGERCVYYVERDGKEANCGARPGEPHDKDCALSALGSADPSPLRRLLDALDRLESEWGGDGEKINRALDDLREAGREVRGVLGGEVPA